MDRGEAEIRGAEEVVVDTLGETGGKNGLAGVEMMIGEEAGGLEGKGRNGVIMMIGEVCRRSNEVEVGMRETEGMKGIVVRIGNELEVRIWVGMSDEMREGGENLIGIGTIGGGEMMVIDIGIETGIGIENGRRRGTREVAISETEDEMILLICFRSSEHTRARQSLTDLLTLITLN